MGHPDRKNLEALENSLIERCKRNEDGAFAGLAELYKNRIHQFVLCILGPDREAEDITQEAFIQIHKSLESFRGKAAFSSWAYALTRNVCRRRLRERGRETGLFSDAGDKAGYELPNLALSAEVRFENQETAKIVRDAVNGLSPLHRTVIFLSCWEHLSYDEISQVLDIPVGTVRSRIHNAMAALAQKLKPVLNPGIQATEVTEHEMPI